jgi:hypothetical protein
MEDFSGLSSLAEKLWLKPEKTISYWGMTGRPGRSSGGNTVPPIPPIREKFARLCRIP